AQVGKGQRRGRRIGASFTIWHRRLRARRYHAKEGQGVQIVRGRRWGNLVVQDEWRRRWRRPAAEKGQEQEK
ncbi:hypothetical protein HK405_002146, partial [Cladochytrium tenue]